MVNAADMAAPDQGPVRTCVGCRRRDAQARLLRVAAAGGRAVADRRRRVAGRGVYVHYRTECVERAARGGIARGLRCAVTAEDVEALRLAAGAGHIVQDQKTDL
jgi:predicted RNA-binding protein YlxR (DUF448 family)